MRCGGGWWNSYGGTAHLSICIIPLFDIIYKGVELNALQHVVCVARHRSFHPGDFASCGLAAWFRRTLLLLFWVCRCARFVIGRLVDDVSLIPRIGCCVCFAVASCPVMRGRVFMCMAARFGRLRVIVLRLAILSG